MNELFRAMPKLLTEFNDKPELREAFVFAAWRKIAGQSLLDHAVPFRFYGKQLVIAVADKMWKRHLELLSGQMIYSLNSSLNQEVVKFIEFRIDEETVNHARSKISRSNLSDDAIKDIALQKITPKLRKSADSIKDDKLRYQFLLAAGSCLARKERLKSKIE
jgi:hypothetical protein